MPHISHKDSHTRNRAPLGSGKRFASLAKRIQEKEGYSATAANAAAAAIGREKYGAHKMAKLSAHGRGRHKK